jgi:hypothetical protein
VLELFADEENDVIQLLDNEHSNADRFFSIGSGQSYFQQRMKQTTFRFML